MQVPAELLGFKHDFHGRNWSNLGWIPGAQFMEALSGAAAVRSAVATESWTESGMIPSGNIAIENDHL